MDEIILGRLSASVIRYIGEVLAEPHDGPYTTADPPPPPTAVPPTSTPATAIVPARPPRPPRPAPPAVPSANTIAAAELDNDPHLTDKVCNPTAIDELMETLTSDVVGYISHRLNTTLDQEPPRIVDVDVIQNLARDVIIRTGTDVAQADRGRQFADKCIEAYVFVGEIEAWLKRNVNTKNKEVLTSIANLKAILQAA